MSIETDKDRLNTLTALGETVTLALADLSSWTAPGIMEMDYIEVSGVESYQPVLTIRVTDNYKSGLPQMTANRAVTATNAAGKPFTVVGRQPDGTGMIRLILEEL